MVAMVNMILHSRVLSNYLCIQVIRWTRRPLTNHRDQDTKRRLMGKLTREARFRNHRVKELLAG